MTKPEKTEPRWVAALLVLFAAGLTLFQLLTASPLWIVSGYKQAGIHWAFIAAVFLLSKPTKGRTGPVVDFLLLAASLACVYGLFSASDTLANASGLYSRLEVALAICQIFLALIIGYKALGKALPLIAIVFLLYTLYSNKIPGMFKTAKVSLSRLAPYLLVGSEGMFGTALVTCSRFIFIFIFFGAVLDLIGAGSFFVDLAFSLTGRAKGGAAQASIYSSMLMGMISGSGPANVVTTGTFTIPLMKKIGFDKDTAGAVEAVAANSEANGIAPSRFEMLTGNIITDQEVRDRVGYGCYDIVAANILAEVLVPLTPVIVDQLKPGGIYITSGIIDDREETVAEAVKAAGLKVLEVNRQGEWVNVTAQKPLA